ncbi:MAG: right-handed parallel beta-helix repeat-containing protein [Sedimentisphaerales bacterium]
MRFTGWKIKLFVTSMVLLLLAVLLVSASSQAASNNAFSISSPISGIGPAKIQQVTGNQAMISIGSFPQGGSPGEPMLPYKSVTLLVPPDANLATATAGLGSGSWEDLPGEYEIAAVKPAAASNGERVVVSWGNKDKSLIVDGKDTSIYGSDAYFPSNPVQVVSVGKFRQFKLVELRVWLAAYNPVQKKVRVLKNAEAALTVNKLLAEAVGLDSAVLPRIPKTEKFKAQLRPKIANPQDIDAFYSQQSTPAAQGGGPAPSNVTADYVIITTNTIVNTSTKLANFIAAKQAVGFTVNTVTEAPAAGDSRYIQGNNCDERANNIRGWLQAHDLSYGIEYVLLIGQPDPCQFWANQSVPMKMCWPRNHQSFTTEDDIKCPTDMYFAELSGNWDRDGNGICGEFYNDYGPGGADKYCEIKVGRIPVYNANYADLDAILQKCIDYGNAPGGIGWRSKVLIPAAVSNFSPEDTTIPPDGIADYPFLTTGDRTFGADWGEAIKSHASTISFNPYTLYEKAGVYNNGSAYPLTPCNANLTNANVVNEWKNKYGFVTWWAHGSQTSSSRFRWIVDNAPLNICTTPAETTFNDVLFQWGDCASLDNNYPSFVVQVSCDNGYPENTINLGYSLLKQGAIGTISGTRTTWYAVGSWNTGVGGGYGDNASYGYYCFDRMGNSAEDIGTALVYCRANFGTGWNDGSSWMNMIGFNLYGDPSLSLNLPPGCVKWEQQPDTGLYEGSYGTGVDIRFDRSDGFNRLLADDFLCTQTGPIRKVRLWGSWHNDVRCQIKKIHLSIHNDKPASENYGMSEPNTLLWSKDINATDINETLYYTVPEWWWDPYTSMFGNYPGDTQIWQYDINIPYHAFVQQGDSNHPIVYWLDAYAELDPMDPNFPMAQFGWKTSSQHWNDDAVWLNPQYMWNELSYWSGHPYYTDSIDLAFGIYSSSALYPYYVDVCATGNNDGTSWTDAYNFLQDALAQADAQLIFVADGTYKPDQGGGNTALDKNASFVLRKGVAIYGGYAGVGAPDPNARNVQLYQTILSGDLAGDDVYVADPCNFLTEPTRAENSYHVVKGGNTNRTAILDGFTIADGNANSDAWPNNYGGGMFNDNDANCIISNCTFIENSSGSGGAIFNGNSNLLIRNCAFYRNAGKDGGGGIHNYISSPTIVNCIFISNKGVDATGNGGGVYNVQNCNPAMINCLFSDNSAVWGGGMANIHASNPTITNCTFSGNFATGGGCGAIDDYNNANPTITNCVFWGNTSPQICDVSGSAATVNYSDVQGGWLGLGANNINADPRFVNADGPDGVVGTLDDNLRLLSNSPCIDKGSNAGVSLDTADIDRDGNTVERTPLDLDLRPRIVDGNCDGNSVVDMGAYEFSYAYAGDFDSDCDVDFSDFAVLANSWLQNNPSVDIAPPPAGDGIVDIKDLAVLCDNWLAGK